MTSVRFTYESSQKEQNKKTTILGGTFQNINFDLPFYKVEHSLNNINQLIASITFTNPNTVGFLNVMLTKYHEIDKDQSIIPDWKAVTELALNQNSK